MAIRTIRTEKDEIVFDKTKDSMKIDFSKRGNNDSEGFFMLRFLQSVCKTDWRQR